MEPKIVRIFFAVVLLLINSNYTIAQINNKHVYVHGYYRSDGTYVKAHYRTVANTTNRDNFSTQGNINPYTKEPGWVNPDSKSTVVEYNLQPQPTPRNSPYIPKRRPIREGEDLTSYLNEVTKEEERQKQVYISNQEQISIATQQHLNEALIFFENSRRLNTGNYFKDGSYFARFVIENTCYDVEVDVKNNRVWNVDLRGCKGVSYPIKHGRGRIDVTCLRDGLVNKGVMYFYFMHE